LFSANELTPAGKNLLDSFVLRLKRQREACGLVNINQEYKNPEEAESMKRSVADYLRRAHTDRLTIGCQSASTSRRGLGIFFNFISTQSPVLLTAGRHGRRLPTSRETKHVAESPADLISGGD
jgi:hypothetical protein